MADRQRNETERAVDLLAECLALRPQHREAARLLHWIRTSEPGSEHLALRSLMRHVPAKERRPSAGSRRQSRGHYRCNDTAEN